MIDYHSHRDGILLSAQHSHKFQNIDWRTENRIDNVLNEDFTDLEEDYRFYIEGHDFQGRPGKK